MKMRCTVCDWVYELPEGKPSCPQILNASFVAQARKHLSWLRNKAKAPEWELSFFSWMRLSIETNKKHHFSVDNPWIIAKLSYFKKNMNF